MPTKVFSAFKDRPQDVPSNFSTISSFQLPDGKSAIFAKHYIAEDCVNPIPKAPIASARSPRWPWVLSSITGLARRTWPLAPSQNHKTNQQERTLTMRSIIAIIATLTVVFAPSLTIIQSAAAESQPVALRAAGLWRSGDGSKQVLVPGLPASEFNAKRSELAQQGLDISSIAVYCASGVNNYLAVFEPTPNSQTTTILLAGTWEQFAAKESLMFKNGFRLVDIALSMDYKNAQNVRYTGVWRSGLGASAQWTDPGMSWSNFLAKATNYYNMGLRPVALASVSVLDNVQTGTHKALFTATWRGGLSTGALYFIPPSEALLMAKRSRTTSTTDCAAWRLTPSL